MPMFHVELIRKVYQRRVMMPITADTKEDAVKLAKEYDLVYSSDNTDLWHTTSKELSSAIVADSEGNRHGVPLEGGE